MSANTEKSNKTHFARLGHATQNLIPKFLQELLAFLEKPKDIETRCKSKVKFYRQLRVDEKRKIGTAASNGNYEDFDISLIYTIFRNLHERAFCPTRGWDHPHGPQPNEITLGDDVERCRRTRNLIIHKGNTSVSDQELEDFFDTFRGIADRLQTALKKTDDEFVSQVDDLKTCCMDEETEKQYLQEIQELKVDIEKQAEAMRSYEEERIEKQKEILKLQEQVIDNQDEDVTLEIIKPLEDTNVIEGSVASICLTVAGARYVPRWYKDGDEILYDRRIQQEVKLSDSQDDLKLYIYSLTINKVSEEDAGTYMLQIRHTSYECSLLILGKTPTSIDLRSYQEELAEVALTGRNTIICAGTNAGKTYVAYHIVEDHLIKHPKGKVVFINKTNVLLQQQYERACKVFKNLFFEGKIYRWDASFEGECEPFSSIVERVSMFFCTPQSLCNHLDKTGKDVVSMDQFTLIILDECHHVVRKNPFNTIMNYYRRHKFKEPSKPRPQILGLTASPGTNKSDSTHAAKEHLKSLMTNMDVSKLSVVRRHEDELLKYSSTPTKVRLVSAQRPNDPVKRILLNAMAKIEGFLHVNEVTQFLIANNGMELFNMIKSPPTEKSGTFYMQWISKTKQNIESMMLKDSDIPRNLHMCVRNLELYVECLEMNSLLEVDDVVSLLSDGYGKFMYEIQQTRTTIESAVVDELKDVLADVQENRRTVDGNPDVNEIANALTNEYEKLKDNARFLVFVKTRASAVALAKRLPLVLKATHLTGSAKSTDRAGLPIDRQLETMERFRDGEHLCIVATSVACEGIDIPQCNLMIRYRFKVDEITSYQMRGRIRNKEGKEVIVAPNADFEREDKNIQRQYYMKKAIDEVIMLHLDDAIATAERSLYAEEERERMIQTLRSDTTRKGEFLINCKLCGKPVSDGIYLRHIKKKQYIILDVSILKRMSYKPVERIKSFDAMKKTAHVSGPCRHSWGIILQYEKCYFYTMSKEKVNFFHKNSKEQIKFKKWDEFPFFVDKLSDEEIQMYLSQQTNDPELENILQNTKERK